jgi:hypothetical protein
MKRALGTSLAIALGVMSFAVTPAVVAKSSTSANYTCSGGDMGTFTPEMIPKGTYRRLKVTGFCEVAPGATVRVHDGLTVAPGGFLVAAGALDGQAPDCNRTITVAGGVHVGAGASLILGDGPGSGCRVNTSTTVNGGVDAVAPLNLIIHGAAINGGVSSIGGGDGLACNFQGFPTYSTIEDSHVNGGVTVAGYRACWLGFARNHINGGVSLTNNVLDDPDAMEILSNSIHGALACAGDSPMPTNVSDESGHAEPNKVTGRESGQCLGL